jgi:hypothetical protein
MPRPRKTVYERMCPACRKLLRTRPWEVAQAAILHIQINGYAEQARKARQKKR